MEDLLTLAEAGELAGRPTRDILELVEADQIPIVWIEHRDGGLRVRRSDIETLATAT